MEPPEDCQTSGFGRDGVMTMPSRSRAMRTRRAVSTSIRQGDGDPGPSTCSHTLRIASARILSISTIEIFQKKSGLRNKQCPILTAGEVLGKTQTVLPLGGGPRKHAIGEAGNFIVSPPAWSVSR